MKKIAFVIPWYGDIPGGAETECRLLVEHLNQYGAHVEILTTCVKEFLSDWNTNYHPEGVSHLNGVPVRRFKVRKRDTAKFDQVNYKLMNNLAVSKEEEEIYFQEMIHSPGLVEYIKEHYDDYQLFVFIPYMFGTTYWGTKFCYDKAVLIPCLHDESYARMGPIRRMFSQVKGVIFHARPEYELANSLYNLSTKKVAVLGEGIDTDFSGSPENFRAKYKIIDPFILYAGRKDQGKNINLLIKYFEIYKAHNHNDLALVLIGGGQIEIPDAIKDSVNDLGFVSKQDKYDAYTATLSLCQPSLNESFSIVIMESWVAGTPVIVNADCEVTKYFSQVSHGGLCFKDYYEFEACVNFLLNHPSERNILGKQGQCFVKNNFSWEVIVERYIRFFEELSGQI